MPPPLPPFPPLPPPFPPPPPPPPPQPMRPATSAKRKRAKTAARFLAQKLERFFSITGNIAPRAIIEGLANRTAIWNLLVRSYFTDAWLGFKVTGQFIIKFGPARLKDLDLVLAGDCYNPFLVGLR